MRAPLPPGPEQPPLMQMIQYVRDPYGYFDRLQRRHGDIFTVALPGIGQQVVVASPEGLKALTTGSYESYERMAEVLRFLLGDRALIFKEGAPHRRLRKVMGPAFQGDRMRAYGREMLRATDDVLASFAEGGVVELRKPMQDITLRVILHCIFGLSDGPRLARLERLLLEFVHGMLTPVAFASGLLFSGRRILQLLERLGERQRRADPDAALPISPVPLLAQAERLGAIDAILYDEIARCRRQPEGREDILSLLAQARDEDGRSLEPRELRDQLIMLMLGGHETTANSLSWALYLLAAHPEVVKAMRREVHEVFPQGFDPLRAQELAYLGAVINESMRLMPIAVGVARRLKHEVTVDGHTLPAGTQVMLASYLAQRSPKLWDNPLAFDPTRFLGKKAAPSAHFPFGSGVWRCLGAAFADYEMRIVLARLVTRFDIERLPGQVEQPLLHGITITTKDGMRLRLKPVKPEAAVNTSARVG